MIFIFFSSIYRVFYFGHGKTYLNTFKYSRLKLDIDSINEYLAVNNRKLVEYGVFYNDNDLDFRKDEEGSSNVIDKLIENCSDLKKIYLLKKTTVYGRILKLFAIAFSCRISRRIMYGAIRVVSGGGGCATTFGLICLCVTMK